MVKIMYEDVLVGEVTTNKSLTVDEALNLIDFDEQEFLEEQGWDDIDYNEFKLVYAYEQKPTHVIFSNDVDAPFQKVTAGQNEDLENQLQEIETSKNNGKRYAHYYKEKFNDYDVLEWHYLETVNA